MEGFTIHICAHNYLWEGLILVVDMMKGHHIIYNILVMSYNNTDG